MKRKEAVNRIISILARSEARLYTEIAEDILADLEEAGMKPPHHPEKTGSTWCNHVNWDTDVYDWEEE